MDDILSDAEIEHLISAIKRLPPNFESLFKPKPKRGHKESELTVEMENGTKFILMMREAIANALDFSAILAYEPPGGGKRYLLRRYNGKSHEHTNVIEGQVLPYDFHIHFLTERYQRRKGAKPEGYAEVTGDYGDLHSAMERLLRDCNFVVAEEDRTLLTDIPAGGK